ncbi:hypothetical protein JD76_05407 [Micromonospora endolithica]|nr:hypothetical protein JD76_05407 [Micromonospora endolithica]
MRSVRVPNEFDNLIHVLRILDRAEQYSASPRRFRSAQEQDSGCAMTGAEALRPDEDAALAGAHRLPEDVGEVLRLAVSFSRAATVTQGAAPVAVAVDG